MSEGCHNFRHGESVAHLINHPIKCSDFNTARGTEAAKLLHDKFEKIKEEGKQTLICLDEFDKVISSQGAKHQTILTFLSAPENAQQKKAKRHILFVATTNNPHDLEYAITSRFQKKYKFNLPTTERCKNFILKKLQQHPQIDCQLTAKDLDCVNYKNMSYRNLTNIIKNARETQMGRVRRSNYHCHKKADSEFYQPCEKKRKECSTKEKFKMKDVADKLQLSFTIDDIKSHLKDKSHRENPSNLRAIEEWEKTGGKNTETNVTEYKIDEVRNNSDYICSEITCLCRCFKKDTPRLKRKSWLKYIRDTVLLLLLVGLAIFLVVSCFWMVKEAGNTAKCIEEDNCN